MEREVPCRLPTESFLSPAGPSFLILMVLMKEGTNSIMTMKRQDLPCGVAITPIEAGSRSPVDAYIREEWGGPLLVTRGNPYDSRQLPGFAAWQGKRLVGAVLYRLHGADCEVAVLFSLLENQGIGSALLRQVIALAAGQPCQRVWLVTSNDNTHAIRFYQKFGFSLKAVHINSFDEIRRLKPHLPARGLDGIPLAHEFEFEWNIAKE